MAQKTAWINGACGVIAINPLEYGLDKTKAVNKVETLNPHKVDVINAIREMTDGRGADVCIDAMGSEPERNFMEIENSNITLARFFTSHPLLKQAYFQSSQNNFSIFLLSCWS